MHEKTIGSDKASIVFINILNQENEKIRHRMLSIYNDYMEGLKEIQKIELRNIKLRLSSLWLVEFRAKVTELYLTNPSLRTHFFTVMTSRRRDLIER